MALDQRPTPAGDASAYVTGQMIAVDGGFSVH